MSLFFEAFVILTPNESIGSGGNKEIFDLLNYKSK